MIRRGIALISLATLAIAACGGSSSDDAAQTSTTRLTLLPTTTTTVPPQTTTTTSTTSTTTVPATTSTTTTSTTVADPDGEVAPSLDALELGAEGIGAAAFSGEPEGVISFLTSFLGAPTADSGWVDPFSISTCSGTELRIVSWGVLTLSFGDFSQIAQGRRHFFAFAYGDPADRSAAPSGLRTKQGIVLGSTLIDVEAAYPGVVLNAADDFAPDNFFVNDNLRGELTGLADDSVVTALLGGQGCGEFG